MGEKQRAFNRALDRAVPGAVATLDAAKLNGEIARLKAELAEAVRIMEALYEAPDMGECEDIFAKNERREARAAVRAFLNKGELYT